MSAIGLRRDYINQQRQQFDAAKLFLSELPDRARSIRLTASLSVRAIVAEMGRGFLPPIFPADLQHGWNSVTLYDGDLSFSLRAYLDKVVRERLQEVRALDVVQILAPALDELRRLPEITAREVVAAAASCFATDPVDSREIHAATVAAFEQLEPIAGRVSELSEAMVLCARADDALEALEKSIIAFVGDRDQFVTLFKTGADRTRFAETVLTPVAISREYLSTTMRDLAAQMDRLESAREELKRALAAINRFTDQGKQDHHLGLIANKTGSRMSGPMFGAGSVKTRFDAGA